MNNEADRGFGPIILGCYKKGKEELLVLTRVRTVNLPHEERNAFRCATAPLG